MFFKIIKNHIEEQYVNTEEQCGFTTMGSSIYPILHPEFSLKNKNKSLQTKTDIHRCRKDSKLLWRALSRNRYKINKNIKFNVFMKQMSNSNWKLSVYGRLTGE